MAIAELQSFLPPLRLVGRRDVLRMRSRPGSVARARRMVDQMLGPTPTGDAARLVVSELVANAVEHARGRIELEIRVGATVLIGVRDHSPDMPYVEHDHLLADRGRGMRLVEAVSRRWWVDREPDAKVVWCEIGLPTTC